MRKLLIFILLIGCVGCVTVKIPKYLKDQFPYKKKFYANFDATFNATQKALKELGWRVSDTAQPATFEQGAMASNEKNKQILIFTEIRQTPLLVSSRYMSLNVYVWSKDDGTEVEIRYLSVTPVLFKSAESYKNDAVVEKIYNCIEELLKS